jgi:WhiB family redox-sensing transcriptional regulator
MARRGSVGQGDREDQVGGSLCRYLEAGSVERWFRRPLLRSRHFRPHLTPTPVVCGAPGRSLGLRAPRNARAVAFLHGSVLAHLRPPAASTYPSHRSPVGDLSERKPRVASLTPAGGASSPMIDPHIETTWLMSTDAGDLDGWLRALLRRPNWHSRAACRGMGTDLFFPTKGRKPNQAIAVCTGCGVIGECRTAAEVDHDTPGVWAGTTVKQRRQVRRTGPETIPGDMGTVCAMATTRV